MALKLEKIGQLAKSAAKELMVMPNEMISNALILARDIISERTIEILDANEKDIAKLINNSQKRAFIDRLRLSNDRINVMCETLIEIAEQKSPVDRIIEEFQPKNGLRIKKITTPIGVIGIIFESRPNVYCDAAALCLRSKNASILRPGTDSTNTVILLHDCMMTALREVGIPENSIQLISDGNREDVRELIKMTKYVDVIVPRGGKGLVGLVEEEAKVPVFAHLEGIVHIYVHSHASLEIAKKVTLNSKSRRPGICGAVETLLIDKEFYKNDGEALVNYLIEQGIEIRADKGMFKNNLVRPCSDADFGFEFLDNILAVKVVGSIDHAIMHIQEYGSEHTDCIITENIKAKEIFFKKLNSSILLSNASTQFADGGEFGFGAEIGIATGKLHARGPIGAQHLVSFQYHVNGTGNLRP